MKIIILTPLDIIVPFVICLVILGVLVGLVFYNYKKERNIFPLIFALIIVICLNIIVGFFFFASLYY